MNFKKQVSAEQDILEIFSSLCKTLTHSSRNQLHKLQAVLKTHNDIVSNGVTPKLPVMKLHVRDANYTLHKQNLTESVVMMNQHRDFVRSLLKVNSTMEQFQRAYLRNCTNLVIGAEKKLVQYVKDIVAEAGAIGAKRGLSTVCLNQYGGIFTVQVQPTVMKIDKCILVEATEKSKRAVSLQTKWQKIDEIYMKYIQRLTFCSMMRPITMEKFNHCCEQDVGIFFGENDLDDSDTIHTVDVDLLFFL